MENTYVNLEGRYMSTYSFVAQNDLEDQANQLWGKGWEAEDDVNQIQQLCDHLDKSKWQVVFLEGMRSEDDIEVRPNDFNILFVQELLDDLVWDAQRMSQSGRETLNTLLAYFNMQTLEEE